VDKTAAGRCGPDYWTCTIQSLTKSKWHRYRQFFVVAETGGGDAPISDLPMDTCGWLNTMDGKQYRAHVLQRWAQSTITKDNNAKGNASMRTSHLSFPRVHNPCESQSVRRSRRENGAERQRTGVARTVCNHSRQVSHCGQNISQECTSTALSVTHSRQRW
jgi:hypothetical protein